MSGCIPGQFYEVLRTGESEGRESGSETAVSHPGYLAARPPLDDQIFERASEERTRCSVHGQLGHPLGAQLSPGGGVGATPFADSRDFLASTCTSPFPSPFRFFERRGHSRSSFSSREYTRWDEGPRKSPGRGSAQLAPTSGRVRARVRGGEKCGEMKESEGRGRTRRAARIRTYDSYATRHCAARRRDSEFSLLRRRRRRRRQRRGRASS